MKNNNKWAIVGVVVAVAGLVWGFFVYLKPPTTETLQTSPQSTVNVPGDRSVGIGGSVSGTAIQIGSDTPKKNK